MENHLAQMRCEFRKPTCPAYAALLTAIVVMGLHEAFDFSFRMTPNAIVFCILAGLLWRSAQSDLPMVDYTVPSVKFAVAGLAFGAIFLVFALLQSGTGYPANLYYQEHLARVSRPPQKFNRLVRLMDAHPAFNGLHLDMIAALVPEDRWDLVDREIQVAMWLQPINPALAIGMPIG